MVSKRLQVIASMCPRQGNLVDIGSDHGLLLQLLFKQGFTSTLYGTELSEDSFQHLKNQLSDLPIKIYQADGLKKLPKDVATIVITGMGGQLIQSMLEIGQAQLGPIQTLILGPQRDQALLRTWLMKHDWKIIDERFVLEDQKGYPMIKAVQGKMKLTPIELAYGPINIQRRESDFIAWLKQESQALQKAIIFQDDDDKRRRLEWIENYVKHS